MDINTIENGGIDIDASTIATYLDKIKDIPTVNNFTAPMYIKDFIIAYDMISHLLAKATTREIQLKNFLDKAKAIAYLEKAPEYLESKKIKDSSAARERYVDIDEDVEKAKDLLAKAQATSSFLKNKLITFKAAHDDVKKIVYNDTFVTPEEGFNNG